MTLNGAIMQLVEMRENSMVPVVLKPYFDKVIETISECIEPSEIPHWIPCSERLPDRFGQVLCTFIPSGGTLWTSVIIAHYSDLMGISKPCFWIGDVGKDSFQNITKQVTAWMPLPAPYREEGDE